MTRHARTGWLAALGACTMLGAAYASVPLYKLFCEVTGYGGTPQRADAAPATVSDRTIAVRFDATTAAGLPWTFKPAQVRQTIRIGAKSMAFYKAVNTGATATTGRAVFNVSPDVAGRYFTKIECFCFTEQTLAAGQTADMPVVYYVDPAILDDRQALKVEEITLSYTFFPHAPEPVRTAASARQGGVTGTRG